MEKILILGASGLVGKSLLKELNKNYDVYGTYRNNKLYSTNLFYYDMSNLNKITDILVDVKPSKIVYCLTGNYNTELALINKLINYLSLMNGKLYFCSTANVFDGDTTKPHLNSHELIAKSEYGKFKIECEKTISKGLRDKGIIFRLPMIWGRECPRIKSLVNSLEYDEEIDVLANLYINTNTDEMLARQIHYIISNDLKGIFHLGGYETINHYEFVKEIIVKLGYVNPKLNKEILPGKENYLAVLPTIGQLPRELTFSNEYVIDYITY